MPYHGVPKIHVDTGPAHLGLAAAFGDASRIRPLQASDHERALPVEGRRASREFVADLGSPTHVSKLRDAVVLREISEGGELLFARGPRRYPNGSIPQGNKLVYGAHRLVVAQRTQLGTAPVI